MPKFELEHESQAGAETILNELGALQELRAAVIQHCEATAPLPPYKPQQIKALLKPQGWIPEVRVKPLNVEHDDLPVNDRYDLWKDFTHQGSAIGVGIEIEKWDINNDLLKFRRGFERGQIGVGIILSDSPRQLRYLVGHLRLITEPLFVDIPILFAAPSGGDLPATYTPTTRKYRAYRMPGDSSK